MKKRIIILLLSVAVLLFTTFSAVQAASVSFDTLPTEIVAGIPGSLTFDIIFDNFDSPISLVDLESYQLFLEVSGASGLVLSGIADPADTVALPNHVFDSAFSANVFNLTPGPTGIDLLGISVTANTPNASPEGLQLAQVTLDYGSLLLGDVITFSEYTGLANFNNRVTDSILPTPNEEGLTFASASIDVNAVPIPGAFLLLGSGLIGLVGLRRKLS